MRKGIKTEAATLRQKAEELLIKKPLKTDSQLSETDIQRLNHELQVHQIELKMQNEELILALSNAEDASKLFDFTPAGNFTLSKEGEIIKLNICGSQMLGKNRLRLKTSRFGFFVSNDTKPIFNLFIKKVFNNTVKESCEVTLSIDDNLPMYVHLLGIASRNGEQCFLSMVDITERIQLEMELAYQNEEKAKRVTELVIANKEKDKRVAELRIANIEKAKRVEELVIADEEKAKRVAELVIAEEERKSEEEKLKKEMELRKRQMKLMVDRELTIIEIKREVNELLKKSGLEEKYTTNV